MALNSIGFARGQNGEFHPLIIMALNPNKTYDVQFISLLDPAMVPVDKVVPYTRFNQAENLPRSLYNLKGWIAARLLIESDVEPQNRGAVISEIRVWSRTPKPQRPAQIDFLAPVSEKIWSLLNRKYNMDDLHAIILREKDLEESSEEDEEDSADDETNGGAANESSGGGAAEETLDEEVDDESDGDMSIVGASGSSGHNQDSPEFSSVVKVLQKKAAKDKAQKDEIADLKATVKIQKQQLDHKSATIKQFELDKKVITEQKSKLAEEEKKLKALDKELKEKTNKLDKDQDDYKRDKKAVDEKARSTKDLKKKVDDDQTHLNAEKAAFNVRKTAFENEKQKRDDEMSELKKQIEIQDLKDKEEQEKFAKEIAVIESSLGKLKNLITKN